MGARQSAGGKRSSRDRGGKRRRGKWTNHPEGKQKGTRMTRELGEEKRGEGILGHSIWSKGKTGQVGCVPKKKKKKFRYSL